MEKADSPKDLTDVQRQAVKDKQDELRTWMKDQNVSFKDLGIGHMGRGHDDHGEHGGPERGPSDDAQ